MLKGGDLRERERLFDVIRTRVTELNPRMSIPYVAYLVHYLEGENYLQSKLLSTLEALIPTTPEPAEA